MTDSVVDTTLTTAPVNHEPVAKWTSTTITPVAMTTVAMNPTIDSGDILRSTLNVGPTKFQNRLGSLSATSTGTKAPS